MFTLPHDEDDGFLQSAQTRLDLILFSKEGRLIIVFAVV